MKATTKTATNTNTTPTRKRPVGAKQDLNSFISRSLSCLFTETAISDRSSSAGDSNSNGSSSSSSTDQAFAFGPFKKRKCSWTTTAQETPSLCSISSSASTSTTTPAAAATATATSSSSTPPLPTTISMSSLRQSRSIGKLSQTDSLCSLVGDAPVCTNLDIPRSKIPLNTGTAYSIISSDCSIRSDLDASFDSRARWNRDSDNDSLSYSDDSSHGDDLDHYGWYTDGEEDEPEIGETTVCF